MTSLGELSLYFSANVEDLERSLKDIQKKAIATAQSIEKAMGGTGKNLPTLTPKVDHTHLYALNKHYDIKERHHKQLQGHFDRNPLRTKVDTLELDRLSQKYALVDRNRRRLNQSRGIQDSASSQVNRGQESVEKLEVSVDTSGIEKAVGSIGKTNALAKIGDTLTAPLRAVGGVANKVVTGALEGVGRPLGEELGQGLNAGVQAQAGRLIGSFSLVGESIGAYWAEDILSSIQEIAPKIQEAMNESLGVENIAREAAASRARQGKKTESTRKLAQRQIGSEYAEFQANLPQLEEQAKALDERKKLYEKQAKELEAKSNAKAEEKGVGKLESQREKALAKEKELRELVKKQGEDAVIYSGRIPEIQSEIELLEDQAKDPSLSQDNSRAVYAQIRAKEQELQEIQSKEKAQRSLVQSTQQSLSAVVAEANQLQNSIAEIRNSAAEELREEYDGLSKEFKEITQEQKRFEKALLPQSDAKAIGLDQAKVKAQSAQSAAKDLPILYKNIAKGVAEASGVTLDEKNIPNLVVNPNLPKEAYAGYRAMRNEIQVPPAIMEAIERNELTEKQLETLVHELRHGAQYGFGTSDVDAIQRGAIAPHVDLLKPEGEEIQQFRRGIEGSVSVHAPELQKGSRQRESDAYTFAARNYKEITKKAQEEARIHASQLAQQKAVDETMSRVGIGGGILDRQFQEAQYKQFNAMADAYGVAVNMNAPTDVLEHLKASGESAQNKMKELQDELNQALQPLDTIEFLPVDDIKLIEEAVIEDVKRLIEQSKQVMLDYRQLVTKVLKGEVTLPPPVTKKSIAQQPQTKSQQAEEELSFGEQLDKNYTAEGLRKVASRLNLGATKGAKKEDLIKLISDRHYRYSEQVQEVIDAFGDDIRKKSAQIGKASELKPLENPEEVRKILSQSAQEISDGFKVFQEVQEGEREEVLKILAEESQSQLLWIDSIFKSNQLDASTAQSLSAYRRIFQDAQNQANVELASVNAKRINATSKAAVSSPQSVNAMRGNSMDLSVDDIQERVQNMLKESLGTNDSVDLELSVKDLQEEVLRLLQTPLNLLRRNPVTPSSKTTTQIEQEINSSSSQNLPDIDLDALNQSTEFKRILNQGYGAIANAQSNESRFNSAAQKVQSNTEKPFADIPELTSGSENIFERVNRIVRSGSAQGPLGEILKLTGGIKGLFTAILSFNTLRSAFSVFSELAPVLIDAAIAMESIERRVGFVSGGFSEGAKNMAFLRQEASRLGVDLKQVSEGFVSLSASTRGTSLEGDVTKDLSASLNQAASVYGLDPQATERAYTAFSQIASKGKLASEELRGQLSESLPGAFQIGARAMGVTTQELNKMLEQGQVLSEDFLPKFAQQLSAETAGGVAGAANSSQAALNNFNNALFETQSAIGKAFLPARNATLKVFAGLLSFVKDNAELLTEVIRFLAVAIGVMAVKNITTLISSLTKIPMVAGVAQAAMTGLANSANWGANKQKAGDMIAGFGQGVQNFKSNPGLAIGEMFEGLGQGAKGKASNVFGGMRASIAGVGESLGNLRKNGISNAIAGFNQMGGSVKAFGLSAATNGLAGIMTLTGAVKGLMATLAPLLLQFAIFQAAMAVFKMFSAAMSDTAGESRDFANAATEGVVKYKQALAEARGETQKFVDDTKQIREETLLDEAGFGWLFPKEIKVDDNWFNKARFKVGELVTGGITGTQKALGLQTWEEKKFDDQMSATNDAKFAANDITSQMLTQLGTNGKGARELGQLKEVDKQLAEIQVKRRGLLVTNPGDKEGIKALDEAQSKLLKVREQVNKPLGILQGQAQTNIDGLKKEIEKFEQLASKPGKNQEVYKQTLDGLKSDLKAAESAQDKFTKAIGETVNAFTLLQKNLKAVADELADAGDRTTITTNNAKSALFQEQLTDNGLTPGEIQARTTAIGITEQRSRRDELEKAIKSQQGLLQTKEAQDTLSAYGVDQNTGQARLRTLSESATGNDKFYLESFANIKGQEIELSQLTAQLQEARANAVQQVRDANKQIAEYYTSVQRQTAELALSAQEAEAQLAVTRQKNKLKSALLGFQDNYVTQFVDGIIESIDLLNQPLQDAIDSQKQGLQNRFNFEDQQKQALELKRSLPTMPKIEVGLDFSQIDSDGNVQQLESELQGTVQTTKALKAEHQQVVNAITAQFNPLAQVGQGLQENVSTAVEVNQQFLTNTATAVGLGDQIDANTLGLNNNLTKAGEVDQSLAGTIDTTGQVVAKTNELASALGVVDQSTQTFGVSLASTGSVFDQLIMKAQELAQATMAAAASLATAAMPGAGAFAPAVGVAADAALGQATGQATSGGSVSLSQSSGKVTENYRTGTLAAQEYGAPRPGRKHAGQDIDVSGNQQAQSFIGGIVTRVVHAQNGKGYGSYVDVFNKQLGVVERIAEVMNVFVKEGQQIKPGQAIGGGESRTGVFHYEIRKPVDAQGRGGYGYEGTQDPIKFYEKLGIAKRQGNQIKILAGLNAGQTLNAAEHHPGDGHNHFGEDDLKKANQQAAKSGGTMGGMNEAQARRAAFADLLALKEIGENYVLKQEGYYRNNDVGSSQGLFNPAEAQGAFPASAGRKYNVGRYQFNKGDWEHARKVDPSITGYTPQDQEKILDFKLKYRNAYEPLMAGDINTAITRAGKEWASLPGSPYGQVQRGWTKDKAIAYYNQRLQHYRSGGQPLATSGGAMPAVKASPQGQVSAPQQMGGAPKLGQGYDALNQLGGELAQNKYFNPSTAEGRGRLAIALGIGGSEAFEKNTNRRSFYTYLGGTGNNMQGFGQFNRAYHANKIDTPEKYKNFFGQILAGEKLLPNSQKGIGDYGAKVSQAVQSGQITSGADLIKWMQANKLGGSNWQGVDDGWKRNPGLADQLVQYLKGGLATQEGSASASPMASAQAAMAPVIQQAQITGSKLPPVTYNPRAAASVSGSRVNTAQLSAAEGQQAANYNKQEEQRLAALRDKEEERRIAFIDQQQRNLRQFQSTGRDSDDAALQSRRSVEDMAFETGDPKTLAQQFERQKVEIDRRYDDKEKEIQRKIDEANRSVQVIEIAKSSGAAGITRQTLEEKFPNSSPAQIDELVKVTQGNRQALDERLATERKNLQGYEQDLAKVQKLRGEAMATAEKLSKREQELQAKDNKASLANAQLATLEAKLSAAKEAQGRGDRTPEVQAIPALEKLIALRRQQGEYEQTLRDIDEREFQKKTPKAQADQERAEAKAKLEINKKAAEEAAAYADKVMGRDNDKRSREERITTMRSELGVLKEQLNTAKEAAQLNPQDPRAAWIPQAEKEIQLREVALDLEEKIAAIEDKRFSKELTDEKADEQIANLRKENDELVKNIGLRADRASKEADFAARRAELDNKSFDADLQSQLTEARAKNQELRGSPGFDPLKARYDIQAAQQGISFAKQMIDLDELEASGKQTKEQVDALRAAYTELNNISLDNLKAEWEQAQQDKQLGIQQKMVDSSTALMDARASGFSARGMTWKARDIQRESALAKQEMSFQQQQVELERFIKSQGLSIEKAQQLRTELGQLNQVQLGNINAEFDPWTQQLNTMQGAFKGFFSDILTGSKSIGEAFQGMVDQILGGLADMAAEWLTNKLFGDLFGMNKEGASPGQFYAGTLSPPQTPQQPANPLNNIVPFANPSPASSMGFASGITIGTTPMQPIFVQDVSQSPLGGIAGGNLLGGGVPDLFGSPDIGKSFVGSLFGSGETLPVNILGANDNFFSGMSQGFGNIVGTLFSGFGGGGGGIASIASSLVGMFGGGGSSGGGMGGGLAGFAMNLLGGVFYDGGKVGEGGEKFRIQNYTEGKLTKGIQEAMQREKAQSGGRTPQLAVLNTDEMVLSAEQTKRFEQLGGEKILNFARGGKISNGQFAQSVAEKTSSDNSVSVNVPVNIQGGNDGSIDERKFKQIIDAKIRQTIAEEQRQGGSLRKSR